MIVIYPVVIIGAGPAGVATAVEVLNRGYKSEEIIILEKSGELAHMIAAKYPEEKPVLANYKERMAECVGDLCITDMGKTDFLNYLNETVKQKELRVQFHQEVSKIIKLNNGQFRVHTKQETYLCDTIFVAIGNMAAPRTLGISVESEVVGQVFYDIQKIESDLSKILVVGGGDSAGEYAKILVERGHQVALSYRKDDFDRMLPQNNENTLSMIKSGKLRYFKKSNISKIVNANGKPKVYFKEKNYEAEVFDGIVTALGAERPNNYLEGLGIKTESEAGDVYSESKMSGLFFVGDLASGKKGGSINFAFNSGVKAVAKACSLYLDCD